MVGATGVSEAAERAEILEASVESLRDELAEARKETRWLQETEAEAFSRGIQQRGALLVVAVVAAASLLCWAAWSAAAWPHRASRVAGSCAPPAWAEPARCVDVWVPAAWPAATAGGPPATTEVAGDAAGARPSAAGRRRQGGAGRTASRSRPATDAAAPAGPAGAARGGRGGSGAAAPGDSSSAEGVGPAAPWTVGAALGRVASLWGMELGWAPAVRGVVLPWFLVWLPALAAAAVAAGLVVTPGALWARRLVVFYAAASMMLGLRSTRDEARRLGEDGDEAAALWARRQRGYARFAYKTIASVRGFFVKAGQYLSSRADVMPAPFVRELSKVQDAMPETPFADVRRIVEADLSAWDYPAGTTLGDAFSRFEPRPIASASIAQVHRAVLRPPGRTGRGGGGASAGSATAPSATRPRSASAASHAVPPDHLEVAVKVQHPGIEPMMLQDAFNLRLILSAVAWFEPQYDFRPVLDEWCSESVKELRFEREGRLTRRVRRALVRAGVDVEVPEVLDRCRWRQGDGASLRWAEGGVDAAALGDAYDGGDADGAFWGGETSAVPCRTLVMRFVRGFKLGDEDAMRQHGGAGQRDGLIRSVVEDFGVHQLLAGCFTGDPHPSNVLLEPVPDASSSEPGATRLRPVLMDFGLAKSLAGAMRVAFSRLVAAASDGDSGHLLDTFDDIGVRLNRENATEDLVMVTYLLRDVQPPTAARAQVMKHRKFIMEQRKKRQSQNKPRLPAGSPPSTPSRSTGPVLRETVVPTLDSSTPTMPW